MQETRHHSLCSCSLQYSIRFSFVLLIIMVQQADLSRQRFELKKILNSHLASTDQSYLSGQNLQLEDGFFPCTSRIRNAGEMTLTVH